MERAVIVLNPVSRNAPSRELLESAARRMLSEGWQVDLRATEAPSHAVELAREAAAAGAAVVFACGGDGTINEVANGLAHSGTALAVLRGGMGDVFGREVGIPRKPEAALRLLIDGERRRFDLGLAGSRYFLLMAGIGFDAQVVNAVPRGPKRLLGSTAYALWGVWGMARYRSRDVVLNIDGVERETRLYWMLLGNTRFYGGVIRIASEAIADDGLLDAYVFEARSFGRLVNSAYRTLRHRLQSGAGVTFQRVRDLEVISAGLSVQVDGEYIGETPMRFSVAPAALDVLLPRGAATELFSPAQVSSLA